MIKIYYKIYIKYIANFFVHIKGRDNYEIKKKEASNQYGLFTI